METNRQKLDILIVEDNLKLPMTELLVRAQQAAQEDALVNGWQSVEVKYSGATPEKRGEYLRYSFDVFGLPGEGVESSSEQQSVSTSTTKPDAAAALSAEV